MNERYSYTTCESADKPLEHFIRDLSLETSHHRVLSQEVKCAYGLQGICCRLCANGPCRITPDAQKGICGADANTIVTRNFLRAVASGSGCYIHIIENAALMLRNTARQKETIKGIETLDRVCKRFQVSGKDQYEKAIKLADLILADLHKPEYEPMELVEKIAYGPRYEKWKELGILPGGAKAEVFKGVVKCSTNLNSDPVDMLLDCLMLGISTGIYGLTLTNLLNDILLGEPEMRMAPVGFRVIDPDYINIMLTGHQHAIFVHLQDYLVSEPAVKMAQEVGAKGFKIIGCTCVGQDMQLRGAHYQQVYSGHAGNNFTSEAILATGAIDAVISEFNCTLPGIEPICNDLDIIQICLDDVAKKASADLKPFDFKNKEQLSRQIMEETANAYRSRRGKIKLNLMQNHGYSESLTGVSEVSLKKFFGDTWQPLIDLIVSGKIKGIAGVVGCSNLTAGGHDVLSVDLVKALIAKDILVLTAGCSSGGIENCGLMSLEAAEYAGKGLQEVCSQLKIPPVLNFGPCLAIGRLELVAAELAEALNIDIPQLPLVLSAAQWLEEQSLADGAFGLALGLPLHLGLPPYITGSQVAVDILTNEMQELTGGQIIIDRDAIRTADTLEKIILEKRDALDI